MLSITFRRAFNSATPSKTPSVNLHALCISLLPLMLFFFWERESEVCPYCPSTPDSSSLPHKDERKRGYKEAIRSRLKEPGGCTPSGRGQGTLCESLLPPAACLPIPRHNGEFMMQVQHQTCCCFFARFPLCSQDCAEGCVANPWELAYGFGEVSVSLRGLG